jgi:hypothetical protein
VRKEEKEEGKKVFLGVFFTRIENVDGVLSF